MSQKKPKQKGKKGKIRLQECDDDEEMLKGGNSYETDSKVEDGNGSGESKGIVSRIFDALKKACCCKRKEPEQAKRKVL